MRSTNTAKLAAAILIIFVSAVNGGAPVPESWRPKEPQFSRFALEGKGQKKKLFFRGNLVVADWNVITIAEDEIENTPVIHVEDMQADFGKLLVRLPCPHGFEVQPYTEYQLSFQHKSEMIEGQLPYLKIEQWDINTDKIQESLHPVEAGKDKVWQKQHITIKTGPMTHYLSPELFSAQKSKAKLSIAAFVIEQVSETGALRPACQTILSKENLNLMPDYNVGQADLPAGSPNYEVNANFSAESFAGKAVLAMEWLNPDGEVVAVDFCTVEIESGLKPEWDLINVRWTRHYNQKDIDGMSLGNVYAKNESRDGKSHIESAHLLRDAPNASSIRFRVLPESTFSGKLKLDKFSMRTY